jgi:NADH-quinone oxidoreductase subunit L
MLIPLGVLALGSILGGYLNVPEFLGFKAAEQAGGSLEHILMAASIAAALSGLAAAWLLYVARPELPARIAASVEALYSILMHKYYIDEVYDAVIVGPVNGIGLLIRSSANGLRRMQTGYVRSYAAWILAGGVLVVAWFLR